MLTLLCVPVILVACGESSPTRQPVEPEPVLPATLSVSDASVVEGNESTRGMVFSVRVLTPSSMASTFRVDAVDGTATGGVDYDPLVGLTLQVPPGEWSGTVEITVRGDEDFEPDESVSLRLTSTDAAHPAVYEATGTIVNDDLQQNMALGVSYEYDELGRLTAVHHDNGRSVQYAYDAAGNLLSVTAGGD